MREILFRGVETDREEWVYGYLIHDSICNSTVPYIGYLSHEQADTENRDVVPVIPETVGQYTGLTDKNGRKIFEGDIVVVTLSGKPAKGIVEYFKTDICGFTVITQPQYSNYVLQKNYAYEVIGNIHDNPELLEADK